MDGKVEFKWEIYEWIKLIKWTFSYICGFSIGSQSSMCQNRNLNWLILSKTYPNFFIGIYLVGYVLIFLIQNSIGAEPIYIYIYLILVVSGTIAINEFIGQFETHQLNLSYELLRVLNLKHDLSILAIRKGEWV